MTFTVKEEVNVKKQELEKKLSALKKMLDSVEGSQTEVYSRIVGYYRSVKNWNAGKRHEYTRRKMYNLSAETTVKAIWAGNASVQPLPEVSSHSKKEDLFARGDTAQESDIVKYVLFVKPNCPNCPPVKNYLAASKLEATVIDVSTDKGLELALQYNVQATPTVVFYTRTGLEAGRACTKKEAERYISSLI